MKWLQKSSWHWARECGRYAVSRSLAFAGPKDAGGHWIYLAFHHAPGAEMAEPIGTEPRTSLESAIADCTNHLITQQRQTAA